MTATTSSNRARRAWRPPPPLSLSEWADQHFYLSAESAAAPGPWHTLPYQRAIMNAITDRTVERVTWKKSARVGATKIMDAAIGYYIHHDPCPIMVVQPTIEDAQGYSKEEIAPMLRDCAVLRGLVKEPTAKVSEQTILHKTFPGGVLSMVGANSGRGFRRTSRRVVLFDEVDGYPPSAGSEGDQISLGIKRTEYYHNRKIVAASTPLVAGASRIEAMFEEGDQQRYHVPCPHCGHRDILVFREGERGHFMQWPKGEPESAYFVCRANGCIIEDKDKSAMLEGGEWIADAPSTDLKRRHVSFHIWAAYSLSPNASWGQLATEFVAASLGGPEKLKTFVNTVLGETWQDRGEAPDWERLYARRDPELDIGIVPAGVKFLTAGVDVQKDRFVFEVVGWDEDKRSYSIDAGELHGDTSLEASWSALDLLVDRVYPGADGGEHHLAMTAVDSGYNTQQVYNWARRHSMSRVIAVKGVDKARTLIGAPSPVDVTVRGKRLQRGYKVWPVGVSIAKSELYGWLRLRQVEGEEPPPGWCHFPGHGEEYFKQLTAEHLVTTAKRNGFTSVEWALIPNRQNHYLDCRVYARAAASVQGLDRVVPKKKRPVARPLTQLPPQEMAAAVAALPARDSGISNVPTAPRVPREGAWLKTSTRPPRRPGGGWLGRRR